MKRHPSKSPRGVSWVYERHRLPRIPSPVAQRCGFDRLSDGAIVVSTKGRRRLRCGALSFVLALCVIGCGHPSEVSATGVTCDQYSQEPLVAANIGGSSQSSVITDMLNERGVPWNVALVNKVQSAVNQFCGKPSPNWGSAAKRNNSSPISEAVDWDSLKAGRGTEPSR